MIEAPVKRAETYLEKAAKLHPSAVDLSLGRVQRLLHELGRPQDELPPAFHVTGTNGKGSTVAFIRSILEADGKRVHTYTSPHMRRFHERIRVATGPGVSAPVEDEILVDAMERVDTVNAGRPITFFEMTTAAAFMVFAEHPADALVCEVGLGGRYDATNVIGTTDVAVMAPVDLDHPEFLGKTRTAVAREKVGIARSYTPLVSARQDEEALLMIHEEAKRLEAELFLCGSHWDVYEQDGRMIYQDKKALLDLPKPRRLLGRHQIENAGLAVAALKRSRMLEVSEEAMARGVENAFWPGRLQRITEGSFAAAAIRGGASEVWVDGGHNPHGAQAVAEAMAELDARDPKPLVIVMSMLKTKDYRGFLAAYSGLARAVRTAPAPHDSFLDPQTAATAAIAAGLEARACRSLEEAAASAANAAPGCRLLLTGSLYAVSAALSDDDAAGLQI